MSSPSITVEAQVFARALAGVCAVAPAKNTVPILSNLLISQRSGTVRLMATDLDTEIYFPMAPVDHVDEMAVTVDAHRFQDIFRNLEGGSQVKLVPTDNNRLSVVSGRSRFALPTLPVDDFPQMSTDIEMIAEIQLDAAVLLAMLQRLKFAQGINSPHVGRQGMCLQSVPDGSAGQFQLVALDHAFGAREINDAEIEGTIPDSIISHQTISLLIKLLDGMGSKVHITIFDGRISWKIGDWTVMAKTIEASFPDINKALPKDGMETCRFLAPQLKRAISRISVLCDGKESKLRMALEPGKIKISAYQSQLGDAEEEMPCQWDGKSIFRVFNAKFLSSLIDSMPTETVSVEISPDDYSAPLRFDPVEFDGDYLSLLTPIAA